MLDDQNVLRQRDPAGALAVAAAEYTQATHPVSVSQPDNDGRRIENIVVVGMGGSALAALLVRSWLKQDFTVPFEVVRTYDVPGYVGEHTLVIASSYSGNTEETLQGLAEARAKNAQVAVIAASGKLEQQARESGMTFVQLPAELQPRMAVIYNLRALVALLAHFGVISAHYSDEIAETAQWLEQQTKLWTGDVSTDKNYAKQLALMAVGKTLVIYAGSLMAPVAYKWKISWNENAKNVAFWNEYPEFNHNEFIGWSSHPVEKPFAVFDLVSRFEHPRILQRFEVSDRLLSGKRPKAMTVNLEGESVIAQMLWGSILADFVSIYVAILNGVDPTPVALIEKLKDELK